MSTTPIISQSPYQPDPTQKLSHLISTLETIHYKAKGDVIHQASKVLLEEVNNLSNPDDIFSDVNQKLLVQLLDAIMQHKDKTKLLTEYVTIITADLMTSTTLSLFCSAMLSIVPYSSTGGGILPIILTSFTNLPNCGLSEEVYSLLISTLFDLHLVLLPNAPEAIRIQDLISSFINNSPNAPIYSQGTPPIVTLLSTSAKYATDDWCSPDAVRVKSDPMNKYTASVIYSGRLKKDALFHRDEKMKYVKSLSTENKKSITTRAHAHAVKCILLSLSLADHSLLQMYDCWKRPIIDCLIVNGFTTEPQKYIPAVKIFIQLMSSPALHVKGLSIVFQRLYLFILNSSLATPQQKQLTLEMLVSLTEKPGCIISMFQFCDCECFAPNIVQELISTLISVIDGKMKSTDNKFVSKQFELDNRMRALKALLNIIDNISNQQLQSISIPSQIPQKLKRKQLLLEGIQLFSTNTQLGIDYFIQHQFCGHSDDEIAEFLLSTGGLNKKKVTEYISNLGEKGKKALDVLMQEIDFTGERFDDALQRMFLMFCSPGEVQVVDNIISRFSERYAECNKALGVTAEQTYILVTSVICLVLEKKKAVSFKQFSEMVGIVSDINVDLRGLYDRAQSGSFALADCLSGVKINDKLDLEQRERVLRTLSGIDASMLHIRKLQPGSSLDNSIDSLKELVLLVVSPCADTCRKVFFEEETSEFVENALRGMQNLIHITAYCGMPECDSLATDLSLWTLLLTPQNMRAKHVLAVRYIITICKEEGQMLRGAWSSCLKVISHLDHLGLLPNIFEKPKELTQMPVIEQEPYYPEYFGCFTFVNNDLRITNRRFDGKTLATLKQLLAKHISVINDIFAKEAVAPEVPFFAFLDSMKTVVLSEINSLAPQVFLFNTFIQIFLLASGRAEKEQFKLISIACDLYIKAGLHPHPIISQCAVQALYHLQPAYPNQPSILQALLIIMADTPQPSIKEEIIKLIPTIIPTIKTSDDFKSILQILRIASSNKTLQTISFRVFRKLSVHPSCGEYPVLFHSTLLTFSKRLSTSQIARDILTIAATSLSPTTPLSSQIFILKTMANILRCPYIDVSSLALQYLRNHFESSVSTEIVKIFYTTIVPKIFKKLDLHDKDWLTTIGMSSALFFTSLIPKYKDNFPIFEYCLVVLHRFAIAASPHSTAVCDLLSKDLVSVLSEVGNPKMVISLQHFFESHTTLLAVHGKTVKQHRRYISNIPIVSCDKCHKKISDFNALKCPLCSLHYFCFDCFDSSLSTHKEINLDFVGSADVMGVISCDKTMFSELKEHSIDLFGKCGNDIVNVLVGILDDYSACMSCVDKQASKKFLEVLTTATGAVVSLILESEKYEVLQKLFTMNFVVADEVANQLMLQHKRILVFIKEQLIFDKLPQTVAVKKFISRIQSIV
ncbi:Guanyl-nucleotide exchange factor [Entamoeba marina]